jgi:hypothetical protein
MITKNKTSFFKRSTYAYILFVGASMVAAVTASKLPERETKKAASLAYQRVRDEVIDKYKDRNPNLLKYKSAPKPARSSPSLGEHAAKLKASATQVREKAERDYEQLRKVEEAGIKVGSSAVDVAVKKIEDPTLRNGVISLVDSLKKLFS